VDGRVLKAFIELENVLLSASNDETRTHRVVLDVIGQLRYLSRFSVVAGMNCYRHQFVAEYVGSCQV
jgi:hypothetical protein